MLTGLVWMLKAISARLSFCANTLEKTPDVLNNQVNETFIVVKKSIFIEGASKYQIGLSIAYVHGMAKVQINILIFQLARDHGIAYGKGQ